MGDRNKLEHLDDGTIAFHAEDGQRWRHRVVARAGNAPAYRHFVSDTGDERHYVFGERESFDATIHDLRDQLGKSAAAAHPSAPVGQPDVPPST
jgi:hypothetical protein